MTLRLSLALTLAAGLLPMAPSQAQSVTHGSRGASEASALGAGMVVSGTLVAAGGVSKLLVEGIERTADGSAVVVKAVAEGASEAGKVSVRIAGDASGAASLAAGSVVEVVSETAGYALIHAGKLIAYIPNELGRSMVMQQQR